MKGHANNPHDTAELIALAHKYNVYFCTYANEAEGYVCDVYSDDLDDFIGHPLGDLHCKEKHADKPVQPPPKGADALFPPVNLGEL